MAEDKLFIFGGIIININSYQIKKLHMINLTDSEVMKSYSLAILFWKNDCPI
jgi:hypothetical protein